MQVLESPSYISNLSHNIKEIIISIENYIMTIKNEEK